MKKTYVLVALLSFFIVSAALAVEPATRHYSSSGEVTSVDPVYSRITIRHGAIPNFTGDLENEFVASRDLLKIITKGDLVNFEFTDKGGNVEIEKIVRTGQAVPKDDGLHVGQAVQDVLVGTGEVVKGVTQPITPVHDATSSTMNATTGATGSVLNDANPDVKRKF